MSDKHRQHHQTQLEQAAAEAVAAPGPFTEARADAVLAPHLPHGRSMPNLDGRVEPLNPPPDRGRECHVKYPKVSGAPYGYFAVYADGVIYALADGHDGWVEIAPAPKPGPHHRPSGFQREGLYWFPQPKG